jgi:hypothetical protein
MRDLQPHETLRTQAWAYRCLVVVVAVFATRCGNSTSGPSGSSAVSDFLAQVSSPSATVSQQTGSLPTSSGGPAASVSGGTQVVAGGTNFVQVSAGSPFQTVNLAVTSGGGATQPGGFFQLKLQAPATTAQITYTVNQTVPVADNSQFSAVFQVVSASGAVGPPTSQPLTKLPAGSTANVTGTWGLGTQGVFVLTQNGTTVTGTDVVPAIPPLGDGETLALSGTLSGSVSGSLFTATNKWNATVTGSGISVTCVETDGFSAQVTGKTMTGTYTSGSVSCNSNVGPVTLPPFSQISQSFTLTMF